MEYVRGKGANAPERWKRMKCKPITITEALSLLPNATLWTWYRGDGPYSRGELEIYLDNHAEDMRAVYRIRFAQGCKPKSEAIILGDYDQAKNLWLNERVRAFATITRRGEKALRDYIRKACEEETGFKNPKIFTHYKD